MDRRKATWWTKSAVTKKLVTILGLIVISASSHSQERSGEPKVSAIVLVHGAFTDGSVWMPVIEKLQSRGYEVTSVQIPLTSLAADVASTESAIRRKNKHVLLVGHSWGGAVISQAGNLANVAGLLYLSALAPDTAESVNSMLQVLGAPLPAFQTDETGFTWLDDSFAYKAVMASDISQSCVNQLAAVQKPFNTRSFSEPVNNAAWRKKRSWYLATNNDDALPLSTQEAIAHRINAKLSHTATSHLSMLARPDDVVNWIDSAAKESMRP